MSYAPYDDYLPCEVEGCDLAGASLGDDEANWNNDGFPLLQVGPLRIEVSLCPQHEPLVASLVVPRQPKRLKVRNT